MMRDCMSRRDWFSSIGAAASLTFLRNAQASPAPAAPVAVSKCTGYGPEVVATLDRMFEQLGGLGRIVSGKTVAMKINLTGNADQRAGYLPAELSHWTHPRVIGAAAYLLDRAGARRIRILESPWSTAEPLEEFMLRANWDPNEILSAARNVEFENTNWLGNSKKYSQFSAVNGGYLFRSYDLNHSYEECDVFVSIAKLKEHRTCGVTLSMKNCFGITPCTIYGSGAGDKPEPDRFPQGGRAIVHTGLKQPAGHKENNPQSPRDPGYRVPRVVADLVAARPVHLAIIDGISAMNGGEGPWARGGQLLRPGLLIAGTNCVSTDAVATALMGFDPRAVRGSAPFERCDNHMLLAEALGAGSCDLKRIEVRGTPIREAVFPFRKQQA